jgi:hypothetical protein
MAYPVSFLFSSSSIVSGPTRLLLPALAVVHHQSGSDELNSVTMDDIDDDWADEKQLASTKGDNGSWVPRRALKRCERPLSTVNIWTDLPTDQFQTP